MSENNFYILCDKVQSGKTTAITKYCCKHESIDGFYCPDIYPLRYFIPIVRGNLMRFQKYDSNRKDDIVIGKFVFEKKTFVFAQKLLLKLHKTRKKNILIDEIGKLELKDEGFEPALSIFFENLQSNKSKTIIIVVRESLLNQVVKKYNLAHATVLNIKAFNKLFSL